MNFFICGKMPKLNQKLDVKPKVAELYTIPQNDIILGQFVKIPTSCL